jgi:hypothetical protein
VTAHDRTLKDVAQRSTAVLAHDRSLLVEAGAGSGKTSLIAGRIATMLANGISPRSVAAVTFTELAASELLYRVRQVVDELLSGTVPKDLRAILPNGLTASEVSHLLEANACIDEITCTTIHGFCQRLIKPYPVEANIDPGASITDRGEAEGILTTYLICGSGNSWPKRAAALWQRWSYWTRRRHQHDQESGRISQAWPTSGHEVSGQHRSDRVHVPGLCGELPCFPPRLSCSGGGYDSLRGSV